MAWLVSRWRRWDGDDGTATKPDSVEIGGNIGRPDEPSGGRSASADGRQHPEWAINSNHSYSNHSESNKWEILQVNPALIESERQKRYKYS